MGFHPRQVDLSRLLNRLANYPLGNLIEDDPLKACPVLVVEDIKQVIGNCLTLPVVVRGQIDHLRLPRLLAELLHQFAVLDDEMGFKTVFDLHPEFRPREVSHVAHRADDLIPATEVPPEGAGLGRRLHDDQLAQLSSPLQALRIPNYKYDRAPAQGQQFERGSLSTLPAEDRRS